MERLYGVVDIYLDKLERRDLCKIFGLSFIFYVTVLSYSVYAFPQAIYPLIMPEDHVSK